MIERKQFEQGLDWNQYFNTYTEQQALHKHHFEKTEIAQGDRTILTKFDKLHILVLTVPWCGDSMATLPVLAKLVDGLDNVELRFLERDDHPGIMDQYLTRGARAVPKIIFLDKDYHDLGSWGPRPAFIQNIFEENRSRIMAGEISKEQVHQILRKEYARDRGRSMVNEIVGILKAVLANAA